MITEQTTLPSEPVPPLDQQNVASSTSDTLRLLVPDESEVTENFPFEEIQIGQSASTTRQLTVDEMEAFASVSGNRNPMHLDQDYASHTQHHRVIAHGMWSGAVISGVLGSKLPGAGTVYKAQDIRFVHPVPPGTWGARTHRNCVF